MLRNKKGSSQDLAFIGLLLLVFSISVLIGFKVMGALNTEFQASSEVDTYGKAASTELTSKFTGVIDNMFLFLTIGLAIGAIALAALVRIHPIFLVFFIIALIIIIFVSGIMSNIYSEMASNSNLSAEANQLTMISFIMDKLPFIVGIIGILLMIVMYKTWETGIQ